MDIIAVIEKYIELSVRRDNLKNIIENSKRYHKYASNEGDIAFYDKDYKSEKRYNDSARRHIEIQEKAEKILTKVQELLEITHQTYMTTLQTVTESQIIAVSTTISAKKTDAERQIANLSQRIDWADSKGDTAFANRNFEEEQEYNHIASECYIEIEKIKPKLYYYDTFIKDLNYHATKKVDQDFGTQGQIR